MDRGPSPPEGDTSAACVPHFRLLTEKQINEIHAATLEILETVGVKVLHAGARDMLRGAGCRAPGGDIVHIPARLVEKSLQSAPPLVIVWDRSGERPMRLVGRNAYFGLGTDLLHTYDIHRGGLRDSRLQDVIDASVVADACEHIDFTASYGVPLDIPANLAFVAAFRAMVEHTVKPIYFTAAGREDLACILEMAAAVAGGEDRLREKPFLIHYAEPISPLVHSAGALDKLLLCAERGIPLNYVPALMAGGTGPVTLAGAIAVANAEALSGLVIHQLRAPGAPMISGFSVTPLDMRHGTPVYGSPEERLAHAACADLYHHYGLPVWGEAGCSDAKCLDEQAAVESTQSILMAALDGSNLVHDIGYLGQGLIGHLGAIVMGNEIIGHVKRILRGFQIDRGHFALDTVRKVGPGGHFLAQKHTAGFFRGEHWLPACLDRQGLEGWRKNGAKPLREVVTEKAREILATHRPVTLPAQVSDRLEALMLRAQADLMGKPFGV